MSKLTMKSFKYALNLYGSDLNQWSDYNAEDILGFIADNDPARELYIEAQSLDMMLDDFDVPEANADLIAAAKAQIVREAEQPSQAVIKPNKAGFWLPRHAYAFASLVCVFLIVLAALPSQNSFDELLLDIEQIAAEEAAHEDLIILLSEVKIDNEIDGLLQDLDALDNSTDDLWLYFYEEG